MAVSTRAAHCSTELSLLFLVIHKLTLIASLTAATTREENIKSAKGLYRRLLDLEPGSPTVHFDVFGVLAYNIDGTFDQHKAKSLVRLFRPSKFDDITLLHFVQSCDSVYKRIRYLRASVGNATLIDGVLENIFNCVFGFVLALTIMSVMKMNPWTLLVSMSTILVSFAFALGPSAAKLIEGVSRELFLLFLVHLYVHKLTLIASLTDDHDRLSSK